jgi:hypothetical protein
MSFFGGDEDADEVGSRRMELSASCLRAKNDLTKVTLEDMTFCVNFGAS